MNSKEKVAGIGERTKWDLFLYNGHYKIVAWFPRSRGKKWNVMFIDDLVKSYAL